MVIKEPRSADVDPPNLFSPSFINNHFRVLNGRLSGGKGPYFSDAAKKLSKKSFTFFWLKLFKRFVDVAFGFLGESHLHPVTTGRFIFRPGMGYILLLAAAYLYADERQAAGSGSFRSSLSFGYQLNLTYLFCCIGAGKNLV